MNFSTSFIFPHVILKNSLKSLNKQKYCKANGWRKLLVSSYQLNFLLESISKATKITRTPQKHLTSKEEPSTEKMTLSRELGKFGEGAGSGACTNSSWVAHPRLPPTGSSSRASGSPSPCRQPSPGVLRAARHSPDPPRNTRGRKQENQDVEEGELKGESGEQCPDAGTPHQGGLHRSSASS